MTHRTILAHRLLSLAEAHERAEEQDHHADTADTIMAAVAREGLCDAALLREVARELGA